MTNTTRLRVEPLEDRVTPAGDLDPTFGSGGVVTLSPASDTAFLVAVAPAPDGDTFAATHDNVYRLNPDGSPDALFGAAGLASFPATAPPTRGLTALPDGGVLLLGGSSNSFVLTKLSPLGVVDPTFGAAGTTTVTFGDGTALPTAATVLSDGRIVVAGGLERQSTLDGTLVQVGEMLATRLTSAGQIDTSFGDAGRVAVALPVNPFSYAGASAVSIGADGRVVLAGFAAQSGMKYSRGLPGSIPTWALSTAPTAVRLSPAGQLDTSFGTGGRYTVAPTSQSQGGSGSFAAAQVLDDGRVLLAGADQALRLTAAGQTDPTYGFGGRVSALSLGLGVSIDAQHRVLFTNRAGFGSVSRLTADGGADPTFGTNGIVRYDTLPGLLPAGDQVSSSIAVAQANGDILLGLTSRPNGTGTPSTRVGRLVSVNPPAGFTPATAGTFIAAGPVNGTVQVLTSNGGLNFTVASPSVYLPGVGLDYRPKSEQAFIPVLGLFTGSPQVQQNVRPTLADVTGDGTPDYVLAAGPGGPPRVVVLDGATGRVAADFAPFETTFAGGAFVAAADLDRDGRAEVIVTPDQGGGGRVVVYSVATGGATTLRASFFGIDDPNFRGGARVAAGDVDRDGVPDVVVAAGFGGGPRVAIFGGTSVVTGAAARFVNDFFAFPGTDATNLRNGTYVAVGDRDGDGFADLVFGGGPGGAPRVFILSGALVSAGQVGAAQAAPLANFFSYPVPGDESDRGGARVAARDVDGDGLADLALGIGAGPSAVVRFYTTTDPNPSVLFPNQSGVFGGSFLPDGVLVG